MMAPKRVHQAFISSTTPGNVPVISRIERVNRRPGCRVYVGSSKEVPRVLGGLGDEHPDHAARGVMTGSMARKAGIGGEVLCSCMVKTSVR